MLEIKEVEWGLASRVGDVIYLNKNLKQYPMLRNLILKHEKAHTSGYTKKDLLLDLNGKYLRNNKKEYWYFIFKHPKSWSMFLPFWVYNSVFLYDPLMIMVWFIMLISIKLIWHFLI